MLYELEGFVNAYAWGKVGESSYIYRFLQGDKYLNSPLAELWFGTHPNGVSRIKNGDTYIPLGAYLESHGMVANLPYLAKFLSVNSPLSIQLHPSKDIAEQLHKLNPLHYPDKNPKPEMSIALTDVSLLCGMRKLNEIQEHLNRIEAFKVFGSDFMTPLNLGDLKGLSRHIFHLPNSELLLFAEQIQASNLGDNWSNIVINIIKSGATIDPGIVYLYLLEYLTVSPGEAIFIEPGVPHAYISGDMFECMQSSDNVVRGGLTTKFIDSQTFVDLFREEPYVSKLAPVLKGEGVLEYKPKDCPFLLTHLQINSPVSLNLPAGSMVINIKGSGKIGSKNNYIEIGSSSSYLLAKNCPTLEFIPCISFDTIIVSPN